MRIREDFTGTVYVHTTSEAVGLVAGDTVPDGVRIDAALVVDDAPTKPAKRGTSRARKPE